MTERRDNRLAEAPMLPVGCRRCGAEVLARKSTWDQTSIQWNAEATARCEERRQADELAGHGGERSDGGILGRGLFLSCSALRDSLLAAAGGGALPIVDDEVVDVTR